VGLVTRHSPSKPPREALRGNATRLPRGFSLLELLIVIVIVGITLGVATLNALPSGRQLLQDDAKRVALLLQTARDEAILRNRLIAFEVDSDSYRFVQFDGYKWEPIGDDDMLRERKFKQSPVQISINPSLTAGAIPLRIVFGREPVGTPFILTLAKGESKVSIRADGIGHFVVE
jgi:general secretion pathway protein H